jgi:hypothetical protein
MGEKKSVQDFGAENLGKKIHSIILNGHKRSRTRPGLDESWIGKSSGLFERCNE